MNKHSLKTKLRLTLAALFLAVLLVWALFFAGTVRSLTREAERNAGQAAGQIITILEEQFLQMEYVSFTLSQSDLVKDFATEREPVSYHEKAGQVKILTDHMLDRAGFIEHLVIYSESDMYYRFTGNMGNTSASRVFFSVTPTEQPFDLAITLDGAQYIGYSTGIYENGQPLGVIVMLMEEGKLQSLFQRYNNHEALQISLASDGRIITSNDNELVGLPVGEVDQASHFLVNRKIGFTPFELIVTLDDSYLWSSVNIFVLAAFATALMFIALLSAFTVFFNRHFFSPMLNLMQGIERLGSGGPKALPLYEEESFRQLAAKINDMLRRLENRNKTIFETQLRLKNAEVARQKAIVISLKKQISAHFTVNVLGVIKRLAELGEMEKTKEMCDGLSQLFQYANAGDEFISGLEEFIVLQRYVGIMQIRFQGCFAAEFDYDEQLGNVAIPRMLLQPLLENAILHGLLKEKDGGRLFVGARVTGNCLVITVQDDGAGMDRPALELLQGKLSTAEDTDPVALGLEHVALLNIQQRIRSYYGPESGLQIESAPGKGTTVTVILNNVKST